MKALLIAMATLMVGQAQAGWLNTEKDFLKTSVRCVAKEDASEMYFKTQVDDQEAPAAAIEISEMSFLPKLAGAEKNLTIKVKGQTILELQFGDSGSSAITLPITVSDGKVFYCNIKQEKSI